MTIEIKELKVLLKLLGESNYRAAIGKVKPNDKTPLSEQNSLCKKLRDRRFIDCSEETTKIKLTDAGKSLLKLNLQDTPLSQEEWKIMQGCQHGAIAPSQTKVTPAARRDEAIERGIKRGFLKVAETKIKEVWLTDEGQDYLAHEYQPSGAGMISISKTMMGGYLRFLRKYLGKVTPPLNPTDAQVKPTVEATKPTDEEILQLIKDLDKELGMENFLPIFYLREKLQPPMSRDEVDHALYRLQRQDKLEISSLVESVRYTNEQIRAGIPQDIGGPLFFLITT